MINVLSPPADVQMVEFDLAAGQQQISAWIGR